MALNEREQRLLDELERGLYESDSDLAFKLGKPGAISPKRLIAGGALLVSGISLLVVAVVLQFALFGVASFLVMLAGLLVATSGARSAKNPKPAATAQSRTDRSPKSGKNFFEDRWDRRQGD
jgi:hypothetical protein